MINATILTGFLGSGKTTLLRRVLNESHGMRIAVIENEFGEENIDNEILVQDGDEQIVQMSNGCICCTIREDLRKGLADLAEKKRKGELKFDHVVIETTGLADPGPVAQTFFIDDEIAAQYALDAVLTLVDAKHAMAQLDQHETAQRQVGFADQIFISKTDLVDQQSLEILQKRLLDMNPRAPQNIVNFGEVELKRVFNLKGFNLHDKLDIDPKFLEANDPSDHHDHHCDHDHEHDEHCHHHHLDDVSSFVFRSEKPFDQAKLEDFLGAVVQLFGPKMLRYKGILYIKGSQHRIILQGVHQLMASDIGVPWKSDEKRMTCMVFIGVQLEKGVLLQGLENSLAA